MNASTAAGGNHVPVGLLGLAMNTMRVCGVVSTICELLALQSAAASLLIYPVYLLFADAAVVAVMVVRRRALAMAA